MAETPGDWDCGGPATGGMLTQGAGWETLGDAKDRIPMRPCPWSHQLCQRAGVWQRCLCECPGGV